MELRDLVIKYRRDHGLSQRAFARQCGLSNGFISMIEAGANPKTGAPIMPSFKNIRLLAEGMGMTSKALISAVDDMIVTVEDEDEQLLELALLNMEGRLLVQKFALMLAGMDEFRLKKTTPPGGEVK